MIQGVARATSSPIIASARAPVTAIRVAKPSKGALKVIGAHLAPVVASVALLVSPGLAGASERVASFTASGFVFKDSVEVSAFSDPEVSGVTLYISDFKRSIAEKLAKDFFTEPSQASLTCAATGPVVIKDVKKISGTEGDEVFSEKKSLNLFQDKTLRVRRIYDAKRQSLIYVAYSTRLSSASDDGGVTTGRYRTSLCALAAPPEAPPLVATGDELN